MAASLGGLDAELGYYTTATYAFTNMMLSFPLTVLGAASFPLFWPLLPLMPLLAFGQVSTLFTEVIARQPLSYPYVYSPLVTLEVYQAMFQLWLTGVGPTSIG